MDLDDYQRQARSTTKSDDVEVFTLGLFGEAGSVASSIKKLKRDNPTPDLVKAEIGVELGDLLWYIAELASIHDLSLSEIAETNLAKTQALFLGKLDRLDTDAPEDQQFPNEITFEIVHKSNPVVIRVGDRTFGDPLDDNSHIDDGYRYHDVFHMAYMSKLGWSPVIRKLLGIKRRYRHDLDRIEDGARAVFLEEGISVYTFNQNQRSVDGKSTFSDRDNIPFNVVSTIKTLTRGIEVSVRDISAWRDTIAEGFQVFDLVTKNEGGFVDCNLAERAIRYRAPNA